MLDHQNNYVER